MKPKSTLLFEPTLIRAAAALFAVSTAAHATDYGFGSVTENFTLTATDHARALGTGTSSGIAFNDNSWGSVYDRGSAQDATYMHFDLSSLAGGTINGTVNLNLTIDAQYGGAINSGVVGSASSAWSSPGNTPGITTISGADPSGNYLTGEIATAVIDNTTFQGFATNPSTFHGFGITAGDGSGAHFSGPATLTGSADFAAVMVTGGTDWSAASASGSTVTISGSNDVSGGNVAIHSGATLAVTDSATLDSGSFSGTFANNGALSFGSSANQTLGGNITGTGAIAKSGAGTLTLPYAEGKNSNFSGGVTITGGTLEVAANTFGTGAVTIHNGGTLHVINDGHWNFGGANPYGASTNIIPSVTVNAGAALDLGGSAINGISNLYLNGGTVTGGGGFYEIGIGALFLYNGNEQITAGGATTSTIASSIGLNQNNNTITVNDSSTLNITGALKNSYWWGGDTGGFIKAGNGTLILANANTYSGTTAINTGTLQLANANALQNSSVSVNVNNGLAFSGSIGTFHAGGLAGSGNIALTDLDSNPVNLSVGANGASTSYSGSLSAAGSLTKTGGGSMVLSGTNTYAGGTTVNAGTLSIQGGSAMPSDGSVTINGGVLEVVQTLNGTPYDYNWYWGVDSTEIKTGGTLTINSHSHIRNLTLSGGELASTGVDPSHGYGGWVLDDSTTVNGGVTSIISAQQVSANNGGFVVDAGSTLNVTGTITAGQITKSGAGTMTLSAANTYAGATTISGGTLVLQDTYASPAFSIASGAVLELNVASGGRDFATATFSGAGTLRKTGGGGAYWGSSAATIALGAGALIDVQEGTLSLGSYANENMSGSLADLHVAAGATFESAACDAYVNALTGAGTVILAYTNSYPRTMTVGVNNGGGTFSGTIIDGYNGGNGILVKTGTGTQILSGANTYTGSTTISGGTLALQNNYGSSSFAIASGATLELNVASGTRDYSASTTFSGAGTLAKTGGGEIKWSAAYPNFALSSGSLIDVQGGTFTGSTNHNANWSGNLSDLNVASGATFDGAEGDVRVNKLTGSGTIRGAYENQGSLTVGVDNGSSTFDGAIADNIISHAKLVKEGSGTITLTNVSSYTGTTTVNGGKLVINGNISTSTLTTVQNSGTLGGSGTVGSLIVQAGGTIAPGNSPGILTVDGDYTQAGTLVIEVNGLTPGSQHDQVNVDRVFGDGAVSLSGSLSVLFGGGYTPANGTFIFILLNDATDTITGTFSGLAQNDIVTNYGGYDWRISYTADSGTNAFIGGNDVALIAVPEPRAALIGGLGLLALLRRRR